MRLVAYAESESSILGGIFLRPEVVDDVELLPEDFHDHRKREVFRAMRALRTANGGIDVVTVADELQRTGRLDAVGGMAFLSDLLTVVPSADNVAHYVANVRKASQTRGVIEALAQARKGLETGLEGEELISHCLGCFSTVEGVVSERSSLMTEVIGRTFKSLAAAAEHGPTDRVPTGFEALDRVLGGLPRGIMTVLAGRPSQGKSALCRIIADNAAAAGHGVHYFSLEDTAEVVGKRTLSDHSRVSLEKFVTLDMREGDKEPIAAAVVRVRQYGHMWRVDDEAGLSSAQICMRVRRHKKALNTKLVVIDYLQHVTEPEVKGQNVELMRTNAAIRAFVNLARTEDIAVVLVAQLNRGPEQRDDKRPRFSDLKDSGKLEEDAKVVLFVYRDEFYTKEKCEKPGIGEVIIAKNSNGRTGSVELAWDAPSASYRTLTRRY